MNFSLSHVQIIFCNKVVCLVHCSVMGETHGQVSSQQVKKFFNLKNEQLVSEVILGYHCIEVLRFNHPQ